MPKVKRWEFDINNQNPYGDPIYEDDNGDFVLYKSYEILEQKNQLQKEQIEFLKNKILDTVALLKD